MYQFSLKHVSCTCVYTYVSLEMEQMMNNTICVVYLMLFPCLILSVECSTGNKSTEVSKNRTGGEIR